MNEITRQASDRPRNERVRLERRASRPTLTLPHNVQDNRVERWVAFVTGNEIREGHTTPVHPRVRQYLAPVCLRLKRQRIWIL